MRRAIAFLLFMSACGSPDAEDGASAGGGTGGTGGEGGAPASEPAVYVSFVAEEGPGSGPALLRMINETPGQILSLTLPTGEAFAFYLVEPGASTDFSPIASADMLEDAILSLHTLDTCVRRPFAEMNGPLTLEPGRAYSIHVSSDSGFVADIVEEPQPDPYVGVRVLIDDRAQATQVGAASLLTLSVAGQGELAFEDIHDDLPAPFQKLEASQLAVDGIRFLDLGGVEHTAPGLALPAGIFGYTIHVSPEPIPNAVAVALAP